MHQALAAVAEGGAHTIRAGVTAADHHHVLAFGGDEIAVAAAVQQAARVMGQEVHSEVDAFERAASDSQIAWPRRPGAQDDGLELPEQFFAG